MAGLHACSLGKEEEIALEHKVQLAARDGYPLGATLYDAAPGTEPLRAAVLCGGGGLPARVYQRFAGWLAGSGTPLLTFDYRGLGASRPARMRGFEAGIEDWMEHDSAAAIAWLRARYPRAELIGIARWRSPFPTTASQPSAAPGGSLKSICRRSRRSSA